jgi:cysteine desulfurase family protein (TIGR01976 family)
VLDPAAVRHRFPALARTLDGVPVVYADGPGGTQAVDTVIEAVSGFMVRGGSNLGGPFATSMETQEVVGSARAAAADLFGAERPDEIVFGQNMTSLTLALGRALARTWEPGDEIVGTTLDHDANVSSWMQAAGEAGATVRLVDFDPVSGRLDPEAVAAALTDRTRLVAVTHASNAIGTVVDVASVVEVAHSVGALVFVDAVHFAPHGLIDVVATGCDFLAASAYKFFGPHTGLMYGRAELLAGLDAVKIRPAPSEAPGKWESGTQSFESLAGVAAAVDYLASLGEGEDRRTGIRSAMREIGAHEAALSRRFLDGVATLPSVTVQGVPGDEGRTPTFAVAVDGTHPRRVTEELGRAGIFVWDGHYYALEVMRRLGVLDTGGLVRIGFVHYNTLEEVDRVVDALERLQAR